MAMATYLRAQHCAALSDVPQDVRDLCNDKGCVAPPRPVRVWLLFSGWWGMWGRDGRGGECDALARRSDTSKRAGDGR